MSRDLLFEIGVEELPAGYIPPALEQLERGARAGLAELRLAHGAVRTYATPRRLALHVAAVEEKQPDLDEEITGPAVKAAYDAEGNPTRALLGFCQGKGIELTAIRRVQTPKGEYVAATVHRAGQKARDVLPAWLANLATSLAFPKVMRWPGSESRFARPVRWLVALYGRDVLPVRVFGLEAGRASRGHRFLAPRPVAIAEPAKYLSTLEGAKVLADPGTRRSALHRDVSRQAGDAGGRWHEDQELLDVNSYMVEWPQVFRGSFDAKYSRLPNEVKIAALREHQLFFAVDLNVPVPSGALIADSFIAVRNGDSRNAARVRKGNEDVLQARLEDALFYWNTDLKHPPGTQVDALANVVWMEGLGSLREKAARLETLAGWIAERLTPGDAATRDAATRAALLCKTDLLSEMIGSGKEYASLQGVIGGYYARAAGEPPAVCDAIYDQYRPRGPSDPLPRSDAGATLALADKLDHVAGAFVGGKVPSGSEDPYGVRRAANGVLRILIEQERRLDLREATMQATAPFFAADPDLAQAEIVKKLGEFWRGRVEGALGDVAYDARDAAIEARVGGEPGRGRPGWIDPLDARDRARVLDRFRADARFEPLVILFKRVANILAKATEALPAALDRQRLTEPAEGALLAALDHARAVTTPLWEQRAYERILPALLDMEAAIHSFFDSVLVNAEDAPTRLNRLRLLADVRELFLRGWDLSKVVVAGEKSA